MFFYEIQTYYARYLEIYIYDKLKNYYAALCENFNYKMFSLA